MSDTSHEITDIFSAAKSDDVELLDKALENHNVNEVDENGMTALHHAALSQAFKTAERLRDHPDIDVWKRDNFGRAAAFILEDVYGRHSFTDKMRDTILPHSPDDLAALVQEEEEFLTDEKLDALDDDEDYTPV